MEYNEEFALAKWLGLSPTALDKYVECCSEIKTPQVSSIVELNSRLDHLVSCQEEHLTLVVKYNLVKTE